MNTIAGSPAPTATKLPWHHTPPHSSANFWCHCPNHHIMCFVLFYFISPFLLLKSSLRNCYHTHRCCMGTTATAYARGMTTQPHPWVCKPPCCHRILPLAPTPAATIASFVGTQVMFFSFLFFVPFLTNLTETLFTPHARSSNPHLSTMCHPSILTSPAAAIACIRRHASKDKFFFLLFFSFLTNVTETLFTPHIGSSNPRLSTT